MELPQSSENECTSDKYINMSEISNHNVGPKKSKSKKNSIHLTCCVVFGLMIIY